MFKLAWKGQRFVHQRQYGVYHVHESSRKVVLDLRFLIHVSYMTFIGGILD